MTNIQILQIYDFPLLFNSHALLLLTPGTVLGLLMLLLVRKLPHPFTLPLVMLAAIITFFAVIISMNLSMEDARRLGWVAETTKMGPFYSAWQYFDFRLVQWSIIPEILPTWIAMFLVVAFSSSLDVAAIETEVKESLDYNHELQMIGISNMLSGLTGGFTGSYIFSQTIFTLRSGVKSRLSGWTIVVLELVTFLLPFSLISFIPRFFFGGLLILIAVDLMKEWLIEARHKMLTVEYLVNIFTFLAIQFTNVEIGMFLGKVGSTRDFI